MIILIEGFENHLAAKTGISIIRYCPEEIIAVLDSNHAGKTAEQLLGVGGETPVIREIAQAPDANTLVIGIAPSGGKLPDVMRRHIEEAINRGWRIESGLHDFLCDDPTFKSAARASGAQLIDVRKNDESDVSTRNGFRPGCLRIHTVGNDCSVGKMVTAIEVAGRLQQEQHDACFVATGQTGIMIAGSGCPIDCVVGDFINGAAEKLVKANQHHDILLIEGQGSLAHPRYSAVTAGLLHGCTPHGLILCYEAGRRHVHGMPHLPVPPVEDMIPLYESSANAHGPCHVIGISMNGRNLTPEAADAEKHRLQEKLKLPVCDVFRDGAVPLTQAVVQLKRQIDKQQDAP